MRLTLRTLLAYLDDTLPPQEAVIIGRKVAESEKSRELVDKIKRLTRKRGLATPSGGGNDSPSNPNTVAEYLSDALPADAVAEMEATCLESDVNLAEVAACHQILTLLLSEPARVPPLARKRMYELVKGPESLPNRKPGQTIPIGGLVADSSRPDRESGEGGRLGGSLPFGWGVRLMLTGGLLGLACLVAWLAWPRIERQSGVVVPHRSEPVAPNPVLPGEHEILPAPVPTPVVVPAQPELTVPKPVEPNPPPAEALAVDPGRMAIGTLSSRDQLVLAQNGIGLFSRLADASPIHTTDRLICLPGYKGKLTLDSRMTLDLWGNLPDQWPQGPLESSVTFHIPAGMLAADLTIHAGRVYLQTSNPNGASVRLRFAEEIWDFTLADAGAELVVEYSPLPVRGLKARTSTTCEPRAICLAVRGSVRIVHPRTRVAHELTPDSACLLKTQSRIVDAADAVKPLQRQVVYPDPVRAAAAQRALSFLASQITPMDRVLLKFAEAINDESLALARVGVFGQAAIGDWTDVASELLDPNRSHVRDAAAVALRAALASQPTAEGIIEATLMDRVQFTREQAGQVLALLRGPSADDLRSPEALNTLVDGLTADTLPVRELSHRILMTDVDPEAFRNPALARFDPTGPVEARVLVQNQWRKRVEELAKPLGVNLPGLSGP